MTSRTRTRSQRTETSVCWQMISGMRAYGVAITVIWTLSATTVLVVLALAVSGVWLHVAFGGAAVLELLCAALTFWVLLRVNRAGHFDV
jgi:hypothetical protein